ncbi:branched-chain amino acid ABC transporter permease [Celeribacter neptunius]|uniref:Amino acid/amide ABC transporter membrane protein 2, HAAT family (TC 3.A.1.4.-) n=1 Tax=Celeribacter neptunius TaxID=588602 RepID=A0A1I3KZD1_9RHOB|nr:branched-chain amino acid ABC transporter permease [Celeribacter neptunius]SFI77833.1 amino acid/amide ABC transporter membrane protein 2, HAAT family (TC 3.A.1.4.-) [Celeribacter neptunius]
MTQTRIQPQTGAARAPLYFALMAALILAVGLLQSWNSALAILNMGLISAIMALGVNLQWGYAGLFNVGVMGFTALGGLAVVLTSMPPVPAAWAAGGLRMGLALILGSGAIIAAVLAWPRLPKGRARGLLLTGFLIVAFFVYRGLFDPAVEAIEAVDPSVSGYLGGLGLPVILSWAVGGVLAAGAAWLVAKTALGLRSDYLAIATLGIAEIIIAVLKNEDWLSRGVKNVNGLPRPVPYEIDLQQATWFLELMNKIGMDPVTGSSIFVKLLYAGFFLAVIVLIVTAMELALKSPWGRMMRAIRDNEVAAEAMGKDVTGRHLQIFVLGAAIIGFAGAMMTTLDGQLTPTTYQPLRYTFLVWVMVIVGGSGNNWGAVLGGMLIWFLWVEVEPIGGWVVNLLTAGLDDGSALKAGLIERVAYMRYLTMGIILLVVLRFSPRGLLPEK